VRSKQNKSQLRIVLGKKIFDIASHALSDIACSDAIAVQRRFSRARWLFARAHGRPDGVPGGILGAREESLRRIERRRPCRRNKRAIQNWLCNRRKDEIWKESFR